MIVSNVKKTLGEEGGSQNNGTTTEPTTPTTPENGEDTESSENPATVE